jgi:hypothetical protein
MKYGIGRDGQKGGERGDGGGGGEEEKDVGEK